MNTKQAVVTITRADGRVFNHAMPVGRVVDFLIDYASVALPDETLTVKVL